jgi:uncharacterized protein (TIGR02246 family)
MTFVLASLVLFALVLVLSVPLGAGASPTDEETITARVMAFAAAWDKHDAKAMAALWAEDGDLVNPFGEMAKSRAEVEQLFADQHAGMMKGTTYKVAMRGIRMVSPGVAVATWDGVINGMTAADGSPFPPFDHLVTVVVVKKGGTWQAASARAMVPAQAPAPAPPADTGK